MSRLRFCFSVDDETDPEWSGSPMVPHAGVLREKHARRTVMQQLLVEEQERCGRTRRGAGPGRGLSKWANAALGPLSVQGRGGGESQSHCRQQGLMHISVVCVFAIVNSAHL